jgi:hypothetical protein
MTSSSVEESKDPRVVLAVAVDFAFLVVIPKGDLLLPLSCLSPNPQAHPNSHLS